MYRIMGADGKSYGPVTEEVVRNWLTENRANAQTLIQPEGSTEWKPLGSFPEFAVSIPAAPPPVLTAQANRGNSRASAKIAAGLCGILLGSLGIHKFILGYTGTGVIMLLVTVLTCGIGASVMGLIGLIEGIIYLTKSDEDFVKIYVENRKEWF